MAENSQVPFLFPHRKSYSHLILRLLNEERAMGLGQSYEDILEYFYPTRL